MGRGVCVCVCEGWREVWLCYRCCVIFDVFAGIKKVLMCLLVEGIPVLT